MTPEQQQWHMHQQMLAMQRQQLEMQRRNRNTANTLIGLFVWTPLIIGGAVFVLWLITASM